METYMKIVGVLTGLLVSGVLVYLGYHVFVEEPIYGGGRRAAFFDNAQRWLIDQLGFTYAGIATMGLGGLLSLFMVKEAFSKSDA